MLTSDHIPDHVVLLGDDGLPMMDSRGKPRTKTFDTSFALENWNKTVRDRKRPGMFVRRHLEACVLTYLASKVKPTTVHADTQGQALPAYALAHLFGFELMPRVRNWADLNSRAGRPRRSTSG
jgi:hypothetical protein